MIVAVTSKRGGTGGTSLSLVMSYLLNKEFNRKVCLVDLRDNNDIKKLLQLNTQACVDNLLSEFGINNRFTTIEENIVEHNGVSVIPGVTTLITNYLLKKSTKIKELLIELNSRFDVVIVDVLDDELLEILVEIGVDILPINVLDQNRLVVEEYQKDMRVGFVKGIMVINRVDNRVWPQESMFKKHFSNNTLFVLPFSDRLKSTMNKDGLNLVEIGKTEFYTAFLSVCECVNSKIEEYNKGKYKVEDELTLDSLLESRPPVVRKQPKQVKKGFFASLFGLGGKGGVKR